MGLRNTETQYGSVTKFLHWFLIVTVILMLCIGFFYEDLPSRAMRGWLMWFHKSLGITILVAVVLMLFWRFCNPKPKWPENMPLWEQYLARITHTLLYLVIILMPIAGWTMSTAANKAPRFFGLFVARAPMVPINKHLARTASHMHEILGWTIVVLLAIHVLGALKHHFIDKNNILKRMLG